VRRDRDYALRRMGKYTDRQFKQRYCLDRATFQEVVDKIRPSLEPAARTNPGGCIGGLIPAELKLGGTLRFLAGSKNLDVADLHGMCEASFFSHVYAVIDTINLHFDHLMRFPTTQEELEEAERKMTDNWGQNFRGVVAALDGLVVKIPKPWMCDAPSSYYNSKGYFAICVQAMCDGARRFRMMSAEHQGAATDSTAWHTCDFFINPLTGLRARGGLLDGFFIVADAAYGLSPHAHSLRWQQPLPRQRQLQLLPKPLPH